MQTNKINYIYCLLETEEAKSFALTLDPDPNPTKLFVGITKDHTRLSGVTSYNIATLPVYEHDYLISYKKMREVFMLEHLGLSIPEIREYLGLN